MKICGMPGENSSNADPTRARLRAYQERALEPSASRGILRSVPSLTMSWFSMQVTAFQGCETA